jgi:hypothetical protein
VSSELYGGQDPRVLDLIIGHPFQSTGQWDDVCEHDDGHGWLCGYSRAEHADQGPAAEGGPR